MLKRIGNITTYCCLVILLLLNGTPREFLHSFTGHEDTVDCTHVHNHSDHHAAFENEHHHCAFLHFAVPLFHFSCDILRMDNPPGSYLLFPEAAFSVFPGDREHPTLRGPPCRQIIA